MPDLKMFEERAAHALAVAMLAHAAPQSENFRQTALKQAVDHIAEYACQLLATHYKLDALTKKP